MRQDEEHWSHVFVVELAKYPRLQDVVQEVPDNTNGGWHERQSLDEIEEHVLHGDVQPRFVSIIIIIFFCLIFF